MRADAARADRHHTVRSAARRWHAAGAIDDATLRHVESAYPDDRVRLSVGLRILAGLAAFCGGIACAGLLAEIGSFRFEDPVLALTLSAFFVLATELQIGRLKRAQAGAETATAFLALGCASWCWMILLGDDVSAASCLGVALFAAAGAWRWGYASLAGVAALFTVVACAQFSWGRGLAILLGSLGVGLLMNPASWSGRPPAHRRCITVGSLVFLAGAYVAANLYTLDQRWFEAARRESSWQPAGWMRGASIIAMIVMPLAVLGAGARTRQRPILAAGALMTAASLMTLRRYHPIGPWWLSLVLGGLACLGLAIGLRRFLDSEANHERSGFTTEPLFGDRRFARAAKAAATVLALSPAAHVAAGSGFEGGGGRSGGGGATGTA